MQEVCRLTVGAQPACPTLVARPRPWPKTTTTHEEWSKTILKSAIVRAERRASARMRRSERLLCAYIWYPWQRPWPGAFPFHAASQNSSFVPGDWPRGFLVFFWGCYIATQLALQLQERIQVVRSSTLSLSRYTCIHFSIVCLVLAPHSKRPMAHTGGVQK